MLQPMTTIHNGMHYETQNCKTGRQDNDISTYFKGTNTKEVSHGTHENKRITIVQTKQANDAKGVDYEIYDYMISKMAHEVQGDE